MTVSIKRMACVLGALFFTAVLAFAAPPPAGARLPENYEVRLRYRDLIFGPRNDILAFQPLVAEQYGETMSVSMQTLSQSGSVYLVFTNEEGGAYPLYSRGSYIIKRDAGTGDITQVKIFVRSEPGSFIRIYPAGDRSLMDVFLLDRLLYKSVVLPVPLERIAVASFATIVDLSDFRVAWDVLIPQDPRPEDRVVLAMLSKLRSELAFLVDSDDGAMDKNGEYRLIADLSLNPEKGFNCSGFVKWIVDGLYGPRAGELLSIEELKRKHLGYRGNAWSEKYEYERDPYFGLDWSRNLATAVLSLQSGAGVDPEAADVRSVPFFEYFEDVGFRVEDLDLLMYLLARTEPGHFYIGSINRDFGADPVLKQHVHLVALFPYFDEAGVFKTAVMERNVETGIQSLKTRFPSDHIHLVRLPASGDFAPPPLNFGPR